MILNWKCWVAAEICRLDVSGWWFFKIKATQVKTGSASRRPSALDSSPPPSLLPVCLCSSSSFLSPWPEEVLLHWCPSIHPSKQKTHTRAHTHLRHTHTHTHTFLPPPPHAYALTTGHTSGGLRAQPSAAHPAHLPPSAVPTFPTYAALALGKVAGALASAPAKRSGWRSTYVAQTASARETGGGGREDTETNQGFRWPLSLNPSIHFSLCLTHMAGFLHVHTSSVATKVTPREGLARPQARRRREWREWGGGWWRWWRGWRCHWDTSLLSVPFFFFFPILHFLSLSLPSVKPRLGAFSATEGRRLREGGRESVALSSSHHPLHPSTPTLCLLRIRCVRPTSGVTAGVDVLFQR